MQGSVKMNYLFLKSNIYFLTIRTKMLNSLISHFKSRYNDRNKDFDSQLFYRLFLNNLVNGGVFRVNF